jgi:hypothetical protein
MPAIVFTTMLRIAAILITTWGLVISPSLCVSGLLLHPCDQDPASHQDEGTPHSHNSTCPDDPCSSTVGAVRHRSISETFTPGSAMWLLSAVDVPPQETHCTTSPYRTVALGPSKQKPFLPGDRPLLI